MQFHLDYSGDSIRRMVHHCAAELTGGPYIQDDPNILINVHRAVALETRLFSILDSWRNVTI